MLTRRRSLFAIPCLITLPSVLSADLVYPKRVNIITSDYDLLDSTYIDRGRIDRVKVGDKFEVTLRGGKKVTQVIVTGVFDRMSSVKIVDSYLLKEGQTAHYQDASKMLAFDKPMKRPAPDMKVGAKAEGPGTAGARARRNCR